MAPRGGEAVDDRTRGNGAWRGLIWQGQPGSVEGRAAGWERNDPALMVCAVRSGIQLAAPVTEAAQPYGEHG